MGLLQATTLSKMLHSTLITHFRGQLLYQGTNKTFSGNQYTTAIHRHKTLNLQNGGYRPSALFMHELPVQKLSPSSSQKSLNLTNLHVGSKHLHRTNTFPRLSRPYLDNFVITGRHKELPISSISNSSDRILMRRSTRIIQQRNCTIPTVKNQSHKNEVKLHQEKAKCLIINYILCSQKNSDFLRIQVSHQVFLNSNISRSYHNATIWLSWILNPPENSITRQLMSSNQKKKSNQEQGDGLQEIVDAEVRPDSNGNRILIGVNRNEGGSYLNVVAVCSLFRLSSLHFLLRPRRSQRTRFQGFGGLIAPSHQALVLQRETLCYAQWASGVK